MSTQTTQPAQQKPAAATDPTISRHDAHMTLNYPRFPVTMTNGNACQLTDSNGKHYLDLFSGFGANVLGHCNPQLIQAAEDQARKLWHVGNLLHTEPQTQLAERIARHGFEGKSYFCHSGSDANEAAFKLARLYGKGKRHKIIATDRAFHGRGFAAMMATSGDKARKGYQPFIEGFSHVPYNNIQAIEQAIDNQTVAVIVEPIQGEGGVFVPDADYLTNLRDLCDKHDLLLICDEVWTGCARTGKWFGYQHFNFTPDIMTLGKAVGCGLAVGVMCAHPRIADLFSVSSYGAVPHATTLGGNCISMAVSTKMFDIIEKDNLTQHAATLGQHATDSLNQLAATLPIKQVRGKGLFIGIEVDLPATSYNHAGEIVKAGLEQGILLGSAGTDVIRIAPPLIVTQQEIDSGIQTLAQLLNT